MELSYVSGDSAFNVSIARKKNVWRTAGAGNFSSPATWSGNGAKRKPYPQPGDTFYLHHAVTYDLATDTMPGDLYICVNGSLTFTGAQTLSVLGEFRNNGGKIDCSSGATLNLFGRSSVLGNYLCGTSSTVNYCAGGDQQIYCTNPFYNLGVSGFGSKYTLSALTVSGALSVTGTSADLPAYLDIAGHGMTVSGYANVTGWGTLRNTGGSSLVFGGYFSCDAQGGLWLPGNCALEFRAGAQINGDGTGTNTGTGAMKFTTSSQTYTTRGTQVTFMNPITVVGAITVTNSASGPTPFTVGRWLDGTVSGSRFSNLGSVQLNTNKAAMLTTGVFGYMDGSASTIVFAYLTGQTLPYTAYQNLAIINNGIRYLPGNTTVEGTLTVGPGTDTANGAMLQCAGYTLTVGGQTTLTSWGSLAQNGAGKLTFKGLLFCDSHGGYYWTGNPQVELQAGAVMNNDGLYANTGTGAISFTTNPQTFTTRAGSPPTQNNAITIKSVVLTIGPGGAAPFNVKNINGYDSSSFLVNQGVVGMWAATAATQFMTVGTFDKSTFTNLVQYLLAGAQTVVPGVYSSLTLEGSGAKKLTGNVSVLSAYLLVSPATLNANGFALTNP